MSDYDVNVAVIMSVYKNDDLCYLKKAIDSIMSQSYEKLHFFLYIDGPVSTEVCSYLKVVENNNKISIHRSNDNYGLATALNNLIDLILRHPTNFEYIFRMDADDISLPSRLLKQIDYMENNLEVSISGGYCEEFGSSYSLPIKKLPLKHEELLRFSLLRCPFIHPTVVFRRKVFECGYRYPINTYLTEDMALWYELLISGYVFGNIPEVLIKYRMDEDTIKRRLGFKKGMSEFLLRLKYMKKMNQLGFFNIIKLLTKSSISILPVPFVKVLYKYMR